MNSIEMTDVDGDALTVIMRDGDAWITCSSGTEEVTVGPFPTRLLHENLTQGTGSAPADGAGAGKLRCRRVSCLDGPHARSPRRPAEGRSA